MLLDFYKNSKSYEWCAECRAPSVRLSGIVITRTTPTSLTKEIAKDMREMMSIYSIFSSLCMQNQTRLFKMQNQIRILTAFIF